MQKDNQKVRMSFSEEYNVLLSRTEKITSAVYLLADFINSDEVLSKNLKDSASYLVSSVLAEDEGWRVRSVLNARKIVFYTSIVAGVGYVSERTNSLLKTEIEKLINALGNFLDRFDDGSVKREERYRPNESVESKLANIISRDVRELLPKETGVLTESPYRQGSISVKDILKTEKDKQSIQQNIVRQGIPVIRKTDPARAGEGTGDRKAAILDVLKKSDNLTVKDFSSFIHDCSEKTIQRDLAALVATGAVSRKGERRWTRYSLSGTSLR